MRAYKGFGRSSWRVMKTEIVLEKPCIYYELSLSKVVQPLKDKKNISTAWDNAVEFIANITTANIFEPNNIVMTINSDENRDTMNLENNAVELFGMPEKHFDGLYNQSIRNISNDFLNKAIEFMINNQPYPKALRPYITLRVDYMFHFIDINSKEPLAGQELQSHVAFFLSKNSNCMPEFRFPFTDCSKSFYEYLDMAKEYMPFKEFDEKSFRIVRPNKSRTGNISRKININEVKL